MELSTTKYQSRVLMSWLAQRGGVERAGVKAMLPENSSVTNLNVDELARALGATVLTNAGVPVTPETAMREATVYACVSLIAGAISTMQLPIFERTDSGGRPVTHDYWWLFNEQASTDWTSANAMQYLVSAKLFYGDGLALLLRPNNFTNKVDAWEPLHPSRVDPFHNSQNGLRYRVTDRWTGKVTVYDPADIIHVPSLGFDGLRSPSPITWAAREVIGSSLARQEYSARFFSQGSTHDIALKSPRKLTKEQIEELRVSYLAKYTGGKNSHSPLILSGGLDVEKLSITPNDAQLIASQQFGVEEICRTFGVPPFMVGATDKTTSWGAGVEQMGKGFVRYTLRRYLGPIQQEFNRKLWPNREKYFVQYDTAELERADFKTRMDGYRQAVGVAGAPGWMTPDEVRALENMDPKGGVGDQLFNGGSKNASQSPAPAGG